MLLSSNGQIPLNHSISEPFAKPFDVELYRVGYTLEDQFSDHLSLRNAFRAPAFYATEDQIFGTGFQPDNRTLNRNFTSRTLNQASCNFSVDLLGIFSTGLINHQVIFEVDLGRFDIARF